MKAKVIKTGETVDVYHEPQHGQITNIYKESVLVNGRMWSEDELDFCRKANEAPQQYIPKYALVAEIEKLENKLYYEPENFKDVGAKMALDSLKSFLDTVEVKEVDIDKLCEFRKNIGFAYPDGASEYQKQLACYRQGIKDVIKSQKGEEA